MKGKFVLCICGVMCATLIFSGCSGTSSTNSTAESGEEEVHYADEDFVADMAKGLMARWDENSKDEEKQETITENSAEYQEMMRNYINAELEYDEKYTDEKFEDSNLQELAIRYVNLLKEHLDLCDYLTVDFDKYCDEFPAIYDERSKIIATMANDYGMTVDEKYQSELDKFLTNSNLVVEQENQEAEIENMISSLQFEVVEEDEYSDWKTYQAIMENTTGIDFKDISLIINLLNDEGVILDTAYDNVSSFAQGAKAQIEFMTDKQFTSTEVTLSYWD